MVQVFLPSSKPELPHREFKSLPIHQRVMMTLKADVLGEWQSATPQHLLQNWAAQGGTQESQKAHDPRGRRAHNGVTLQELVLPNLPDPPGSAVGTSSSLSLTFNELLAQGAPKCGTIPAPFLPASYHSTAFCHQHLIHT